MEKVWAYDSDMKLYCFSAKDGKLLWKVGVLKQHAGRNPKWENASAPLVADNLVIVYGGGSGQSFLAFERNSRNWCGKAATNSPPTAPILATIHGNSTSDLLLPIRIGGRGPKNR